MSEDYAVAYNRKSKKQQRKKRRNRVYKSGGKYRGTKVDKYK